eukprot:TRINITY_DN656_c0_g2_i1.p1 TRINITY_DN656_c0_g2~~TRINITY_DN656_c0_g2_i1.p1  ORF type:complete len:158 (-),score=59.61 TRINITY_DN656_c0_g2_i1:95-568(-)
MASLNNIQHSVSGAAYPPRDERYHTWHEESIGRSSSSKEPSLERSLQEMDPDPAFVEKVKQKSKMYYRKAIADELAEIERQKNQEEYLREKAAKAEEKKKVDELLKEIRRSRVEVSKEEEERQVMELVQCLRREREAEGKGKKKEKSRKKPSVCSVM